jgi:holo-[acyl-carrier protein] synthase
MSVLGMGVDLVDVAGFEAQLDQPGSCWIETFTGHERAHVGAGTDRGARLAARWAAREAFVKAWEVAVFGEPPPLEAPPFGEVSVVNDAWGRPRLQLSDRIRKELCASLGTEVSVTLSLSHDGPSAIATVVLSQ